MTETLTDQSENLGIEFALGEIAEGATGPGDTLPMLPSKIAANVGIYPSQDDYWEAVEEALDAWETGYYSTWQVHLSQA